MRSPRIFRSPEAADLLRMARRYTLFLDRYEVPWVELRTEHPGRIVYEDRVQFVAVPFTHDADWPLRTVTDDRSR